MAERRISYAVDVENGERHNREAGEESNLDEYSALNRYISTARDNRRGSTSSAGALSAGEEKKKPWWKFGGKTDGVQDGFVTPDEWLETDLRAGLASSDIEPRRKKTGWNELVTEKTNIFVQFIGYFRGPILYVMELAVLLAAGLRDWIDLGVICGILLLNALVGWYQEKQAADVVASLKGDIAMRAIVVRNGQEEEILARELVAGDIVIIEEGTVIPADVRLICDYTKPEMFDAYKEYLANANSDDLKEKHGDDDDEDEGEVHQGVSLIACDQSAITGESLAVDKYMADTCYYTTGCKRGKAYGIVTATARHSFVGRTAALVQGASDSGHFKAVMDNIGTSLLVLVMFWILAAWIGGFFRHLKIATPEDTDNNLLHYTLILLIIGVPVGLPVVTTTTLAVGAAYLAEQKAIVQKLTAIESLAGVDVLCSDKTGTLTANQLSIREPFVSEGVDVNWMMAVAAIASSHNIKNLDPIDKVTVLTLRRYPKAREILARNWVTEKYTPFDPVSKRIQTVCTCDGVRYICSKGAPKAILNMSQCSEEEAKLYREKASEFARRGFRSLGVAVQKEGEPWQLLGMYPMFDPPREDTAHTIAEAQVLGLSVKMLTGDAIAIAKETCKMLALGTKVYDSERLIHGGLAGSAQHDLVEKADGFAEVFPEHKYQVVEMLQQRGHLTAMTGDGVNDAPSLKKADCGIAVEGSTEAAQAAADIVFLAPGLSTIVDAIKLARQIFQRMKAYIQYRIALCLHLEIYLVTSMIIINETVDSSLIVFIALFADLATIAVAYDNAHFEARPVEWQLPKIWVISVVLGILLAAATWIIRGTLFLENGGIIQNFGSPQEILFLEIALTENWLIFVTRGGKTWPSWQLVIAIFIVDVLATLFCVFGWLAPDWQQTSPADPAGPGFSKNNDVDIVTVVVIWAYSIGVTVIIAVVYYLLTIVPALDNLGRKTRSKADTQIENMIAHLSKLAIEHEKDSEGRSRYVIGARTEEVEDDIMLRLYFFSLLTILLNTVGVHSAAVQHVSRQQCQSKGTHCPPGTIIVSASDKRAHFPTIQGAIDSLPADTSSQTILILAGNYTEQLNVTRSGPVTLLGQTSASKDATRNRVRIIWAAANKDNTGQSVDNVFSSVLVVAPTLESSLTGSGTTGYAVPADTPFGNTDFRAYNIDFDNIWAEYSDGPAHALSFSRANGGFYYCGFYSYQDTVYVGKLGNAYFYKSIIAGQTDFLYGFGTAWIQSSDLQLRGCGGGITAWKGSNTTFTNKYGVYIVDSNLRAANASIAPDIKGKCALGRPWNSQHRSIFANSYEDGTIDSSGYIDWVVSGVARFEKGVTLMAEYGAFGPGFNASGRVAGGVTTVLDKKAYEPYSTPQKVFQNQAGVFGNTKWIDWDTVQAGN
ncbi:unnamed protein product [Penicillium olsonii]|uniref:P-type H(+)-exporting transporter n=1 Tax=Penicillium olsonii TaxID=99116 RepID=A0A9W4N2Z0_PENOL|nr:unnamed protein product [Penicillium olsonii]CAG8245765.1 unnamed protein product [Penicillium olsonii]